MMSYVCVQRPDIIAARAKDEATTGMHDAANLLDGLDIDLPVDNQPQRPAQADGDAPHFFGPYQLIQQVGKGGVARVLRARHIHPRYAETTFAIKILHEELSRDPKVVSLFRHEAYVLSLLKHPNIVQTFEAGSQDGELFIAMEYIDGRDLDNMMVRCQRTKSPLPLVVAMHIIGEVLKALAYAHELADGDGTPLNLVHRDVNPANVFLSYDGRVKLGDFGVASIAAGFVEKDRELAGKVGYFAPEQLAGDAVDHRADIFSLGVMLFEMLTGTRLFAGEDTGEIMRSNKRLKIPKPTSINTEIPEGIELVILAALERKPDDRFPSARAMLQTLGRFIPPPVGMSLAVAALMRKVFLPEHIQELQLREGLSGSTMVRGSGQIIGVCTTDQRAQAAFNELLLSRGYRPMLCPTSEAMTAALASPSPPAAMLIDVGSQGFSPAAFIRAIGRGRPVPVVAVSEALAPQWIHFADAIGAVDLLFKPFNIERVLTALRAAISGAARIAGVSAGDVASPIGVRPHVLLLTKDSALATRLTSGFAERDYDTDVSPTAEEALERTDFASYHAVIYDAYPASPADRLFAAQFRGRPAMGLVPIIYLAAPEAQALFAGIDADRAMMRPRTDPPAMLAEALNRLWADNRLGRIFIRYPMVLPVELRYGGRAFAGQSIDISRGGVMLRCEQMAPVGTAVSVAIKLPTQSSPVEAAGRVLRVDMPQPGGDKRAGIGVEFERFAGRGEPALIAFLRTLDPASIAKRTVILGAPERPRS